MKGKDVTVNAVALGPTATPLFLEDKSDELIQQIASGNPFSRLGTSEDVAVLVAFLAGEHGVQCEDFTKHKQISQNFDRGWRWNQTWTLSTARSS
jgi:NAD(P)-dependent dehydrogenase (short-subunit alcohol dehydrogenase family)